MIEGVTLRSIGAEVGDKIRFIDDPQNSTRTIANERQLDFPHLIPVYVVQKWRHPLASERAFEKEQGDG